MIFWELFYTFFKIGLFSFGGGYAMLALIQDEVVNKHAWISVGKFTDIIAISQVSSRPIIQNAFKGLRIAVVGLILSASVMLMNGENFIDGSSLIICAVSCLLIFFKNISAIYLMLASAIAGIMLYG